MVKINEIVNVESKFFFLIPVLYPLGIMADTLIPKHSFSARSTSVYINKADFEEQ